MNDIVWEDGQELENDSYIEQTEKELGVIFPNSFKEIVRKHDGGRPNKPDFVCDYNGKPLIGSACQLGYMNPERIKSVSDMASITGTIIPAGVFPFAEDGGGNCVCFDYRNNPIDPEIVYYYYYFYYDDPNSTNVFFVAKNFDEFLEKLFGEEETPLLGQ